MTNPKYGTNLNCTRLLWFEPLVLTQLAEGGKCGIDTEKNIRCWGPSGTRVPALTYPGPFVTVSADGPMVCGIRENGEGWCLNSPYPIPAGPLRALSLSDRDRVLVALHADGTATVTTNVGTITQRGPYKSLTGTNLLTTSGEWQSVNGGTIRFRQSCDNVVGISSDNSSEQTLGLCEHGTILTRSDEVRPTGRFVAVSVGDGYSRRALRDDGRLVMWSLPYTEDASIIIE